MGRWNVPLCWLRFSCDLSCPIWQPAVSMRHQSSLPGTVQYCTHLLGRQDRPAIHPAISQQCIYYRRPGVGRLGLPCHQDLSLTDLGPATGRGFAGSPSILAHLCWASFLPRHQHQCQLIIRTGERCRATWIALQERGLCTDGQGLPNRARAESHSPPLPDHPSSSLVPGEVLYPSPASRPQVLRIGIGGLVDADGWMDDMGWTAGTAWTTCTTCCHGERRLVLVLPQQDSTTLHVATSNTTTVLTIPIGFSRVANTSP